ncbi:hypothetical protein B296_00023711, partial [Ensete ventricosum]
MMQWELAERFVESLPKVSGACREFIRSSLEVIRSFSRRRQEFIRRRLRNSLEDYRGCRKAYR